MNSRARLHHRMLASLVALAVTFPAAAQNPSAGANAGLAARHQQFLDLLAAAERTCLSNTSSTEAFSLRATVSAFFRNVAGAIGFTRQSEAMRGAARDLPPRYRAMENDRIRSCMDKYTPTLIGFSSNAAPAADDSVAWPEPIDLHLNMLRAPVAARPNSDIVQINLQSSRSYVVADRLAKQDPRGLAFYNARIRYPRAGEVMRGTLVAETPDGYISSDRPAITSLCFDRPPNLPPPQSLRFDEFDCAEGKVCKPSDRAAGWLRACPRQFAQLDPAGAPVRSDADAIGVAPTGAVRDHRRKWIVPSIASLAAGNPRGVGYTIFTIDTDMFRDSAVTAVELDLDVNGTPVLEQGLEPAERPIANDPMSRLSISFALQALDFVGANGGCDRIGVRMQPVGPSGPIGSPVRVALDYVALRDVLGRTLRVGGKTMAWSAGYVVPEREWRALSELRSFSYAVNDAASRDRVTREATAAKRALDALRLSYRGAPVVGVVRPPRTIQANGTAAFGLAAGVVQPNGQVRFTFSPADAVALGNYLHAAAAKSADVARVVRSKPFLFQASSAARTVPGICETAPSQ